MKHYFRLLFVSSVLFILLGLNERQSGNTDRFQPTAASIEFGTFQAGILPASSIDISGPLLSAGFLILPRREREIERQKEEITSAYSLILFQWISCRFMRYRPGIMRMAGYLLNFPAGKHDPPLS
jgi:hypothetical protein